MPARSCTRYWRKEKKKGIEHVAEEDGRTGKDINDDGGRRRGRPCEHTESEMVFWGEGEIIVIVESEREREGGG